MKVKVECLGPIDVNGIDDNGYLDLGRGASVYSILRHVDTKWFNKLFIPTLVNGEKVKITKKLKEGDVVTLLAPVFGG